MTEEEAREAGREAALWLASPEGQAEMKACLEAARVALDRLRRARRVTWEQLNTPCDAPLRVRRW